MTIETIQAIASQKSHIDIMEDQIMELSIQLQRMREEHQEIIQMIIKDNR